MSKSRGRKKRSSSSSEQAQGSVNTLFKQVLREFGTLGADPDPLDVEALASSVAGDWWADPDGSDFGNELINYAQRTVSPGSAALLAAMREVAPESELRERAAGALDVVVGKGIPEPEWAAAAGRVRVGPCWRMGDVFGDRATVLCLFEGTRQHGIVALLDLTRTENPLPDLSLIDEPDELLAEMRAEAAGEADVVSIEQIEPATARRLIEGGLAAMDASEVADPTEDFLDFRALTLARCRAMPAAEQAPAAEPIDPAAVVDEFLAASDDLADTEATRECARLLVDFGMRTDPARPLRVGPEKLLAFAEDTLALELDEEVEETLGEVLLTWAAWAGRRQGLQENAIDTMIDAVSQDLDDLAGEDDQLERYLDGIAEDAGPDELAELLDRRMFAFPSMHTEIGGEELTLDPQDPEQRQLLVVGEHPDYHDALADGEFEGEIDGVPVQLYFVLKAVVLGHLWDDDPPEVWQAASRLRDHGQERDDVLGSLILALADYVTPGATEGEVGYDLDGYLEALNDIA